MSNTSLNLDERKGRAPSVAVPILRIFGTLKWWHILTVFLLLMLYWMAPFYEDFSRKDIAAVGGETLATATKEVSGKHGTPNLPTLDVSVTPLVKGIISMELGWNLKGETYVADLRMVKALRTENIILLSGLCLGVIIALAAAKPLRPFPLPVRSHPFAGVVSEAKGVTTAEETLSDDVAVAANRAADVYRRSTFLLAGGILMAFIGVSVFAFTVPTTYIDDRSRLNCEVEDRLHFYLKGEFILISRKK